MITVKVSASKEYDVLIGSGLLASLGNETAKVVKPGRAVIVSDSNIWPLYGNVASESLKNAPSFVTEYSLISLASTGSAGKAIQKITATTSSTFIILVNVIEKSLFPYFSIQF